MTPLVENEIRSRTRNPVPKIRSRSPKAPLRALDLFSGGGGSSWGATAAGVEIVAAFDLWPLAGKVHRDNLPKSLFIEGRLEEHDVDALARDLGPVDLILASPECTNHSPAKGSAPRCEISKDTAFQVVRFARAFKPRWVVIENVINMQQWSRYAELKCELEVLGYCIREQVLNSKDFGVPQSRRRLFLLCERGAEPAEVRPERKKARSAGSIVDLNGRFKWSPLRKPGRAEATLERADRAITALGSEEPFLVVYYGSDRAGGWQGLGRSLRTITTVDRFALVKPTTNGHFMRMLQVPELKAAMGMPKEFRLEHGTRRDKIKMIGNAVCPPVMQRVIECLTEAMESSRPNPGKSK